MPRIRARVHEGGPDATGRRVYKVHGMSSLEDAGERQYTTNALHCFFKISVEMQQKASSF